MSASWELSGREGTAAPSTGDGSGAVNMGMMLALAGRFSKGGDHAAFQCAACSN